MGAVTRVAIFSSTAVHVGLLVLAHDGAAEIEHLRALAHQPFGQRENAVVVAGAHHVAEVLQARGGVHLLGNDDGLRVRFERQGREGAGRDRLRRHRARRRLKTVHRFDHRVQMLRRGAAAAAHHLYSVFQNKATQPGRQFRRRQFVDRVAALVLRQSRVGLYAHRHSRALAEKANRVVHLRRSGCAVQADHVGLEGLQHSQRRADLRAQQHGPGGFQSDLHLERNVAAGAAILPFPRLAHGVLAGGQGDLGLQQILAGFDDQHVHAALDQRLRLLAVSRGYLVVANVAQRGQLGSGPYGAGHETRLFRGRVGVSHLARQPRGGQVQLAGTILKAVLGQHNARCAECVGLDHVATGLQKRSMNPADHLRPRQRQQLVAPLLAPEILRGKVVLLHIRAHRAVIDQHAPFQF